MNWLASIPGQITSIPIHVGCWRTFLEEFSPQPPTRFSAPSGGGSCLTWIPVSRVNSFKIWSGPGQSDRATSPIVVREETMSLVQKARGGNQ